VHRKIKWVFITGIVLASVSAIGGIALSSVMVGLWGSIWWPALGATVVALILVPALWQRSLLQHAETRTYRVAHTEFPEVQAFIEKGWKVGKRPPQQT
jgi:hypothetical protein